MSFATLDSLRRHKQTRNRSNLLRLQQAYEPAPRRFDAFKYSKSRIPPKFFARLESPNVSFRSVWGALSLQCFTEQQTPGFPHSMNGRVSRMRRPHPFHVAPRLCPPNQAQVANRRFEESAATPENGTACGAPTNKRNISWVTFRRISAHRKSGYKYIWTHHSDLSCLLRSHSLSLR